MASIQEAFAAAVKLYQSGNTAGAEQICRQILAADPASASAWNFLGVIALNQRRFAEAAAHIRQALTFEPESSDAYNNLGLVFHQLGQLDEAAALYQKALTLNPSFAEAHRNLGLTIHYRGRPAEAIEHYRRAIELEPNHAPAHVNLGNALKVQGDLEAAAAEYELALKAKPDFAAAVHNLASIRLAQGQFTTALKRYEQAVALAPDLAEAHKNLSQLRLLLGDFDRGWPEYEWRWKTGELPPPRFSEPRWNGEPLNGKTILLVAEQGLGDTIQFVRYAPLVTQLGAKVLVQCPTALHPLLRRCAGIAELLGANDPLPAFDFYIPLLSLPGVVKTDLQSIPAAVPYLAADPALVERWKAKLASISGFRIGLNWQGRPGNADFALRDMPLDGLASLAEIPNVRLISLQKEEGRDELLQQGDRLPILDLGDRFDEADGSFMDTAAVMRNLDLVITSDTAIAHLAGALAVPVWVGLPFVPNWRWLLNRSDSPWYPTMHLFRQPSHGDWQTVVNQMRKVLARVM